MAPAHCSLDDNSEGGCRLGRKYSAMTRSSHSFSCRKEVEVPAAGRANRGSADNDVALCNELDLVKDAGGVSQAWMTEPLKDIMLEVSDRRHDEKSLG